ncbi:MAG: LysM peptidoglycan-binding domain-containing protein [bacterium]
MSRWAGALALLLGLPAASGQPLNDYIIKPGDSCAGIAARVFGDGRQWRRIGEYNPAYCGQRQRVLLPGEVLRLPWPGEGAVAPTSDVSPTPAEPPGADAQVTTVVRQVEARAPDAPDWQAAARGTDLFRGWRVSTGDDSLAELTFRDTSMLALRPNALVIVYGQTARSTRRPAGRARLERGALKTRLAELAGKLTVETAGAEAELGQGSGLVAVDAAGTSLVANHDGVPAVVTAGGRRVEVPAGMGSKIEKGQQPTAPRPLPPAPARLGGPREIADGALLDVMWSPVDGAAGYRVDISRGLDGAEPVAAGLVEGASRFLMPMPPGRYAVTVSTLGADGFESRPSEVWRVAVGPTEVALPGGGVERVTSPVPTGARLVPPPGFRCGVGAPADGPVLLTRAGNVDLVCADDEGPLPGARVRVEAVRARVVDFPRRLKRGQPITLKLRLESKAPLPAAIALAGPPALAFDPPVPLGGGEFQATLRATGSVQDATIQVLAGDAEISHFTLNLKLPGD